MNLPNTLTILRLFLIPIFLYFLIKTQYMAAGVVFIMAGATDVLDGFTARVLAQKTRLGSFLDPISDKLLVVFSFTAFLLLEKLPLWIFLIVFMRDFLMAAGTLVLKIKGRKIEPTPLLVGKVSTGLNLIIVLTLLGTYYYSYLENYLLPQYILSAVVTGFSYIQYGKIWLEAYRLPHG